MKGAEQECFNAGMDDYISKPIDHDTLISVLNSYFPSQSQKSSASEPPDISAKKEQIITRSKIFDWDNLNDMTDHDEQLNREILDIFVTNLENDMNALTTAYRQNNLKEWDEWAHKMYGACASIGALDMAFACNEAQNLSTLSSQTADQTREAHRRMEIAHLHLIKEITPQS